MQVNPDVVARRLDDEVVLVHLRTNEIYRLNFTGARFWELLGEGLELDEVKRSLESEFEVDRHSLDHEVERLVAELTDQGLLQADATPELSPGRLDADSQDGWVLAVPRRPASARAEARAVESAGTYAGDGSCGVLFDGYLYDRAELMKGPFAGQNGGPSDPRLVLEAYRRHGEGVVSRLSGRFALVLWDSEQDLVLCARDPLGIHPLFYAEVGDELRLSSSFETLRWSAGCRAS